MIEIWFTSSIKTNPIIKDTEEIPNKIKSLHGLSSTIDIKNRDVNNIDPIINSRTIIFEDISTF